jgi:hypothetical protein
VTKSASEDVAITDGGLQSGRLWIEALRARTVVYAETGSVEAADKTRRNQVPRRVTELLCCLIVTPACRPVTAWLHPTYLKAAVIEESGQNIPLDILKMLEIEYLRVQYLRIRIW